MFMNKSVVFITRMFGWISGIGNWDRELMKQLARRGYNIHAISYPFPEQLKKEEQKIIDLGVKLHYVKAWNQYLFFIGSAIELYRIAKKNRVILYTFSSKPIPFYYPLGKLLKISIIFSMQGAELKEIETRPEFENLRKHKLRYKIERRIVAFREKISAKLADRIIVISKAIKDELIQLGIPEGKIDLIYYAIDTNLFKKDLEKRKNIREQYGLSDNEIVINYTARLSMDVPTRMWSAEMLIKTFASLSHTYPNVKIMFVGGGDGVEYLKKMSRDYGIEDKVIFVGFVPHDNVPDYLSASDIFWFVMRDPLPTYGLALQEAMSCENIVIANDSGAMKEVIRDGDNGFLVEPTMDKMKKKLEEILKKDGGEIEKIKKAARKDAEEKYSWDIILLKITHIFDNLI